MQLCLMRLSGIRAGELEPRRSLRETRERVTSEVGDSLRKLNGIARPNCTDPLSPNLRALVRPWEINRRRALVCSNRTRKKYLLFKPLICWSSLREVPSTHAEVGNKANYFPVRIQRWPISRLRNACEPKVKQYFVSHAPPTHHICSPTER